jgi:hypothetical protein
MCVTNLLHTFFDPLKMLRKSLINGAPGRIRTSDPLVRSQILYPTELRALCPGGERGIRTLDGLLAHTPLAGERLRPLGHLSEQCVGLYQ